MVSSTMRALTSRIHVFAGLVVVCLLFGCASFDPVSLDELDYLARQESKEAGDVTVAVSVLTRDEARQAFGKNLDKKLVQPVWLEVKNQSDSGYWIMLHGLDPDYFSVREAAAAAHVGRRTTDQRINDYFDDLGVDVFVEPGETVSGFVFSNLKLGTKHVRVRLFGEKRLLDFEFFISVPGLKADWQRVDFESLYTADEFIDIDDPLELRDLIEGLMCCTTKKNGKGSGDPINLVVFAEAGELNSFVQAGWDETEIVNFASSWRTFKAFVFGSEYKYSPISALYIFGRPQDISLQKARDSIHERNHLRLWLTPWRFEGISVWVGAVSRDIGVIFTPRSWNLTTHQIDSEVDEARNYLIEDLATSQRVSAFGLVNGVGASSSENPQKNLLGTSWWSDGKRLVLDLSDVPVSLEEMKIMVLSRPLLSEP